MGLESRGGGWECPDQKLQCPLLSSSGHIGITDFQEGRGPEGLTHPGTSEQQERQMQPSSHRVGCIIFKDSNVSAKFPEKQYHREKNETEPRIFFD